MFQNNSKTWFGVFLFLAFMCGSNVIVSSAQICTTGSNLIVNGDAEADAASYASGNDIDVSSWNPETGEFTIGKYGVDAFPDPTDPGPTNRGSYLFAGGNTSPSSGSQTVDLSPCATQIDAGNQSFSLSGYFGGYTLQNDNAQLTVTFKDASNNAIGSPVTIGPVLAAERNNTSGLLPRSTSGTVPAGTRSIDVVLLMTRLSGTYNDGYADNLSFILTSPTAAMTSISGQVTTADGRGIKNIQLLLTDSQGNNRTTTTTSFGYYHFDDVQTGETYILSATGKHFTFSQPVQVLNVREETNHVNFIAESEKRLRVF
jgi:hypothetical protein